MRKIGETGFGKRLICFSCDGSGKVRVNRMVDGAYMFAKSKCNDCKGTGLVMKSVKA